MQESIKNITTKHIIQESKSFGSRKCQHKFKLEFLNIKSIVVTYSLVSVSIYIIMIEGLGKGVKYSLFVANAIIFVSMSAYFLC